MNILNIHIYPSTFRFESRILKETKSIIDLNLANHITIIALWEPGLKEYEVIDNSRDVRRFKLSMSSYKKNLFTEALKFIELTYRLFREYKNTKVNYINAHSLSVLPIGVIFKIFKKSILIYDAHELETLRNGLYGLRQKVSSIMEKLLMPFVDEMIVVSNSIATWYKTRYKISNVNVIRNVPYFEKIDINNRNILKEKFNIKPDEILFIYQGLVSKGRGIELLLNVFKRLDKNKHLVIMGYGDMESFVKEVEFNHSNIHFHPAVKQDEIIRYTSGADVGLSLIENTCLSYYYCLPNKIFEYFLCGLPVIVSNFPDMGELVDKCNCGWKSEVDEIYLEKLIRSLTKAEIDEKKKNALATRIDYGWNFEEKILEQVYTKLKSA